MEIAHEWKADYTEWEIGGNSGAHFVNDMIGG